MENVVALCTAFVWVWIIVKIFTEFVFTLKDYDNKIYVGNSILRTHQNLSILIMMLGASLSSVVALLQFSSAYLSMFTIGLWVPAVLLKLMLLYQCEIYRQERIDKYKFIGFIQLFIINFKRQDGKINKVDQK